MLSSDKLDLLLAREGALLSSTSPSSLSMDPRWRLEDSIRNLSKYDIWDEGRSKTETVFQKQKWYAWEMDGIIETGFLLNMLILCNCVRFMVLMALILRLLPSGDTARFGR